MRKWNRTIKIIIKLLILISKLLVKLGVTIEEIKGEVEKIIEGE